MIHIVCDLTGCTAEPTADDVMTAMQATVARLGCSVHACVPVTFVPHGTTTVLVLGESHLVVSTWPEFEAATVDLCTCRADCDPVAALTPIFDAFGSPTVRLQRVDRIRFDRSTGQGGAELIDREHVRIGGGEHLGVVGILSDSAVRSEYSTDHGLS